MDLLIRKGNQEIRLSELGLWVQDVLDQSPNIATNYRTILGRQGRTNAGATFAYKSISVTGKVYAGSSMAFEQLKDTVHGWVVDTEPFYITKMLPVEDNLYHYENAGDTTGDLDIMDVEHVAYMYRWKVITSGIVNWQFLGKSDKGLLFQFAMTFETAEMPFGETIPVTKRVTNNIVYAGTANNSQLEYPWRVELTANQGQAGTFNLKIGENEYVHTSATPITSGQKFLISGISTITGGENVTHRTNYGHFILKQGNNLITTNFKGTIDILDYKELYK